jgi:hypothetical protein
MSCEHLICARCAGPVAEGRCPVCQAMRSDLHHHHSSHGFSVPYALAMLLLVLAVLLALQHLGH